MGSASSRLYSSIYYTGTHDLVKGHPQLVSTEALVADEQLCRKDTGGRRLRKWSRGHQFVVRGGGHIDAWQPLFV